MNIYNFFKKRNDPLHKNSYYLMINNLINSFFGFIFWIVAARLYSSLDVGLAVALVSASNIIIVISLLGLDVSIVRFLAHAKNKIIYLNTSLTLLCINIPLTSFVFILVTKIWNFNLIFINDSIIYIIFFLILSVFGGFLSIYDQTFISLRDTKYCLFQNLFLSVLKVLLLIFLLIYFTQFNILISICVSLIITIFFSTSFLLKKVLINYKPSIIIDKKIVNEISHFSIANYLVNILSTLPASLLPLIILNILGPEENAYFYITFMIANILFIITTNTSASLFAESSFKEQNFSVNLNKAFKQTYTLLVIGIIVVLLFGKNLLLVFGNNYSESGYYLLVLLSLSGLFVPLYSFYVIYLKIKHKIKELLIITFSLCLCILLSSYFLLFQFNILGIGFSYLIAYIFLNIIIIARFLSIRKNVKSNRSIFQ